jgi:ABC-type bacteriocin/lantibiotic exporter with double-glycine peptidase domain
LTGKVACDSALLVSILLLTSLLLLAFVLMLLPLIPLLPLLLLLILLLVMIIRLKNQTIKLLEYWKQTQIVDVQLCIIAFIRKQGIINSMTACNNRIKSNSRNERINRTGNTVGMPAKVVKSATTCRDPNYRGTP